MEAQPKGSVSGLQDLKTELTEMLEVVVVPEMSGLHEQCIYKVPRKLRAANPEAYTPQVVSIGPFHHKPRGSGGDLEPMEERKLKYLKGFLNRTQLCADDFVLKLEEWENTIRSCYAGPVNYNSNDFLKMIIIDACFIIEFFLRYCTLKHWMEKDPLLFNPSLRVDIKHDLILLENQFPFFVLENIYNLADIGYSLSFLDITFHYFRDSNLQNMNPERVRPKHFTDLLRTFMLPSSFGQGETTKGKVIEHVYSASELSEAGLVFKVSDQRACLLDIEYHEGVLIMPRLNVHDETEVHMRNNIGI